jgi:membrane-associated phospholipid phosphatase
MSMRSPIRTACLLFLIFTSSYAITQSTSLPANPAPATQPARAAAVAVPVGFTWPGGGAVSLTNAEPAQSDGSSPSTANPVAQTGQPICGFKHLSICIANLGEDEKGIFTSPLHVQPKDAYWLAPLGAATGLALAYDGDASSTLGHDQSRINTAGNISQIGEFWATGGESAGIYFLGLYRQNPKLAETGRLAAESILSSGSVTLVTKLATDRQRPREGNGQGDFWTNRPAGWTWDSSFPSGHATASMALARVIAGEYPHWYVMLPAYGFAETVSIGRVLALAHFPSDVIVGQTFGFLSATYVLNHRSLYRPGAKKTLTSRLLGSVSPVMDPRTHTLGATMEIPLGN